jgi:uncharacterized protein YjiS (DUF1127 family)
MSNQQGARDDLLKRLIARLACLLHGKVIDPVRRHARSRAGERALAQLDDRVLRDIGLTRSQAHAAAYGLLKLGRPAPADSTRAFPSGAAAAPRAEGAAQG